MKLECKKNNAIIEIEENSKKSIHGENTVLVMECYSKAFNCEYKDSCKTRKVLDSIGWFE